MNNSYRDKALSVLQNSDASFVYVSGKETLTSESKGIRRLLLLVEEKKDLSEGFVADRIVGKAAALLMVLQGARQVYADTLSEPAYAVFEKYGVKFLFRRLVPVIINRAGDGICPMEKAVLDTDDPKEAYETLAETVKRMSMTRN